MGLETRPELVWEDWDLGKEFTKRLVLKNMYSKLQKLHLRSQTHTDTPLHKYCISFTLTDTLNVIFYHQATAYNRNKTIETIEILT